MQNLFSSGLPKKRTIAILIVVVLLLGFVGVIFTVKTEKSREEVSLITRAKTAVAALAHDQYHILNLTGTKKDVDSEDYKEIKDALKKIKDANADVRFTYLLGSYDGKKLIFYADNEPANSPDISLPGDIYEETTQAELNGIRDGIPFIEGPHTDYWGTWISAFTPVIDEKTGKIIALFGMDVNASTWNEKIRLVMIPPVLITLFVLLLILFYDYSSNTTQEFIKKISIVKDEVVFERKRLEEICMNVPFGIIVAEAPSGNVFIFNKKAQEILGGSAPLLETSKDDGVKKYNIIHEDGSFYAFDELPLGVTLKTGRASTKQDIYIKKPDGKVINTRGVSVPIRNKEGKVELVVLAIEDITLEREIDKMKSEFVSLTSHQLQTPLSSIKWVVEALQDEKKGPLTEKQKTYLEQINESNERLLKLVQNLLNVSRIESGEKFSISKKPVDVSHMIDSIIFDLKSASIEHGVEIKKMPTFPEKAVLNLDEEKIRQVFQNLMSNAIKYSKNGGTVDIDYSEDKDSAIFTIKDDGVGIPKKQQIHVFEKFFRGDNVQSKERSGTGLGLYIAKAIIEKHGGSLRFESEENVGTTFYITLKK